MTHTREIFRHGRYAQCQVLTNWEGSKCPKYILCNDLERGDLFLAEQSLGTWCEVDLHILISKLNEPASSPQQQWRPTSDTEYSYVCTPQEMKELEKTLRYGTQERCDIIEGILRKARVKWYDAAPSPPKESGT